LAGDYLILLKGKIVFGKREMYIERFNKSPYQLEIPVRKEDFLTQNLRKPVTLNEYMPKEMRMKTPTSLS
jgi:hypothetical protein